MRSFARIAAGSLILLVSLAAAGPPIRADGEDEEAARAETCGELTRLAAKWLRIAERHAAAGRAEKARAAALKGLELLDAVERIRGDASKGTPRAAPRDPSGGPVFRGIPKREALSREGGGDDTERAVELALDWLARHQSPDGYWDCDGFAAQCPDEECGGPGHALYDPGVTGLALMAFLGAGDSSRAGDHRETVKRAVKYLRAIQDPEGCFGPRTTNHFTYNHAVATAAMVEAFAAERSAVLRRIAQRGVDFILKARNPDRAWRYGVRPGDNDTSVTTWMATALFAARRAGLRVDEAALEGTRAWLDKVTEPEYGRAGYTMRGTGPARPQDLMDKWPSEKSEALTASGLWCRMNLGEDPRESDAIRKGTALLMITLPCWDEEAGCIDMYYWHWGTSAMFLRGGEPWKRWNRALKGALLPHQETEGGKRGSWDPAGPWGRDGGRVYSTALCALALESYYRLERRAK
jgi:hypothetical protein